MAKVLGVGGVFFRCKDVAATRDWYARVLGLTMNDYGGTDFLHAASAGAFPQGARTVWAPFDPPKDGEEDYFGASGSSFMMNYIVDDLDAVLTRARAEGATEAKPAEAHSYGKFGWLTDPDGRRVELWQPIEPAS